MAAGSTYSHHARWNPQSRWGPDSVAVTVPTAPASREPGTGATSSAAKSVKPVPGKRDVLLGVEGLGREAVAELHRMLGVLRSPNEDTSNESSRALTPQPRLADLEQLASRLRAAGVPVELKIEGSARQLPAGLELAGYRVVQEALTNVLKHSPGATAQVHVAYTEKSLELVVQDNGAAAHVAAAERTGLGLTGIRERVALYGGQVETGPTGKGFRVRATLPVATGSSR